MGEFEIEHKAKTNQLEKCIVISITSPGKTIELQNSNIVGILRLQFDDTDKVRERLTAMGMDDGYKIKEFIQKYKDEVKNIIVHCEAGISRSAGIACGLALYLNGDDTPLWKDGRYLPNHRCYGITAKAFGIRVTRQQIEKNEKLNTEGRKIYESKFEKEHQFKISDIFIKDKLKE